MSARTGGGIPDHDNFLSSGISVLIEVNISLNFSILPASLSPPISAVKIKSLNSLVIDMKLLIPNIIIKNNFRILYLKQ